LEKVFVAPRDALETQLTKIWSEVLGIQPIGVKDNFFELGGHSLMAVRLFALISQRCGKSLPLATLFQHGTVEELASILRQKGWSPSWSSLVPIQPQGSRRPFFCVHPGGGNVLCYADLARHLGSDQPFFGLQARGLDGKQAPHTKIEDMAAQYIQEMRTLQPQGPYLLGGFCLGGIVAFEMAQQLHAEHQKVALLAMVDCGYPLWEGPEPPHSGKNLSYYLRRLVFHWQRQPLKALASQIHFYLISKVKQVSKKLSYLSNQRARALETILLVHAKARMIYEPQFYPGKITLIQTTAYNNRIPDCQLKWSELTNEGLDYHVIPSSHEHMLEAPYVQSLANQLRAYLDRSHIDHP
jgi:thioesterase domain-containing protein/acyl carrier protein